MRTKKKQNKNKHIIGNMRVLTTANNIEIETPEVFILNLDFDFVGNTTPEEYEQFTESVYKYFFKKYPQDKKIININLPDVEGYKSNIKYFNKKVHHCKVEVYLRNEKNQPFDEWEADLMADQIKPICDDIEDLFWKNGFLLKVSVKKGTNLFG